ncbi:Glycine receptor subunit alpha-3 [Mactra antiquata]
MDINLQKMLMFAWMYCCLLDHAATASNETMSTILAGLFNNNYDKKLPPKYDRAGADRQVVVGINMYINSMFSISEKNMDYSMSIFLRERWVDDRLVYNDTLNLTRLNLHSSLFDDIWEPDLYIVNEKYSDYHEVTVPNKLIHIYPDGTVQMSARVTGTFSCLMHLQKYPFDDQHCHFEVESYGFSTETMKFEWSGTAVSIAESIEFPQFTQTDIRSYICEKDYYGITYPCVGVTIVLKRNYAYHMIQIYIPSILIVVLSWVNFWLDVSAVPARISLGLLTVLTMTTQSSGARADLPKVSYVKAIDVYMATCLTFVFLALLEFALINVLARTDSRSPLENKIKKTKITKVQPADSDDADDIKPTKKEILMTKLSQWWAALWSKGRAPFLDRISRFIFPVSFLLFNLIYWVYYFNWNPQFYDEKL